MKYTRTAALTALGVAAALSLTACGSDDSGKDTSGKSKTSSSASESSKSSDSSDSSDSSKGGSSGGGSSANGGSGSGGSEAGNAKSGAGDTEARAGGNGAGKGADEFKPCATKDLTFKAEKDATVTGSGRVNITMTNKGMATCSVSGFPDVKITDEDHTTSPIGRGKAQPRITDLQNGDSAVFNLAYEADSSGDSMAHPTEIQVTPPKASSHAIVDWPADASDIKGSYVDVEVYPTHSV